VKVGAGSSRSQGECRCRGHHGIAAEPSWAHRAIGPCSFSDEPKALVTETKTAMASLEIDRRGLADGRQASRWGSALNLRNRRAQPQQGTRNRTALQPFVARFVVINLIGVALVAAAWAQGLLLKPFEADHSGMCYLITILFLAGLVSVFRKDWQTVRWAGNAL